MNNREAFEAWAGPEFYALDKREGSDIYRNVITRNAWIGWQAALASQAQQPNAWQQAIDDELVNAHLGIAKDGVTREEAKAELNKLIAWHIDVAKYFDSQAQQESQWINLSKDDYSYLKGDELIYAYGIGCGIFEAYLKGYEVVRDEVFFHNTSQVSHIMVRNPVVLPLPPAPEGDKL